MHSQPVGLVMLPSPFAREPVGLASKPESALARLSLLPNIRQFDPQIDPDRIRRFYQDHDQPRYGNSWIYLTQAVGGRAFTPLPPFGYLYDDGQRMAAIGYFPRRGPSPNHWNFHVVRPVGQWSRNQVEDLCRQLNAISGSPVYLKKIDPRQARAWIGGRFQTIENYPWSPQASAEDDTFPEIVLAADEIHDLVQNSAPDNELRRKHRKYAQIAREVYQPRLQSDAWQVVQGFFHDSNPIKTHLSAPEDYRNMLLSPPSGQNQTDYFASLYRVNGQPVAFFFADRIGPNQAGVYANLTANRRRNGLAEFLVVEETLRMRQAGIQFVNLGGSETPGLHQFKLKFRPAEEVAMNWLTYS